MPVPPDSTIRLPILASAGADDAFKPSRLEEEIIRLFDELRNRLLRYLLSLGLSAHDGEEIIQEVFLALCRHLQQGKSRENLRGWVFRVAHNLALKQRHSSYERMLLRSNETVERQRADPGPNPEEQMAARQRQERLRAVIDALPEQDRCCLHLRAEGLRYREISRALGMSLGAVFVSLERSLARLGRADAR
jgi:RNA polymerase sigma-70 factor (ECF subfamily)